MFRNVEELKGLIIDVDSIENFNFDKWEDISNEFKCLFFTCNNETKESLCKFSPKENVLLLDESKVAFAPNLSFHNKVLELLNLNYNEVSYISANIKFISRANNFLSGTILINNNITYQNARSLPDWVVKDQEMLGNLLENNFNGYFGEVVIWNHCINKNNNTGSIINIDFMEDKTVSLYTLGRYFGKNHYMSNLHPYSKAILYNKIEGKKYTGVFNDVFMKIFGVVIQRICDEFKVDGICSVPVKPNKTDRYEKIIARLSEIFGIKNYNTSFHCTREYQDQKNISAIERANNVQGAFSFDGDLDGETIILIDDIITTGETLKECVKELKGSGAKNIVILVLAINQQSSYWSTQKPNIFCEKCKSIMELRVSSEKKFFFACRNCYYQNEENITLNFKDGWHIIETLEKEKLLETKNK